MTVNRLNMRVGSNWSDRVLPTPKRGARRAFWHDHLGEGRPIPKSHYPAFRFRVGELAAPQRTNRRPQMGCNFERSGQVRSRTGEAALRGESVRARIDRKEASWAKGGTTLKCSISYPVNLQSAPSCHTVG
jgi:hypothetical protein